MVRYLSFFFIVVTLQLSMGCSSQRIEPENHHNHDLYTEIGGHEGIEKLVDAFVKRIARDKKILPYFAKASVKHFKEGFINHLCMMIDGPCIYRGDTMVDIHTGMHINEADFNRVVELLIQAMEDVGISYPTQNKILAKLVGLRGQIIKK